MKVSDFFTKDAKELERLSKLKLPLKKSTEKLLLSKPTNKYACYYSLVHLWRGKIVERVFATRVNRKGIREYQEVIRRIEGNEYILTKNIYLSAIGGYKTVWKDRKVNNWYFTEENRDKWYVEYRDYNLFIQHLFTDKDLAALDPSLKYCAFKNGNVIDWVTIYRKYPEIEMISKLNMPRLIVNTRVLELLKDRKFKKYLYHCEGEPNTTGQEVLYGYKHNIKISEVYKLRENQKTANKIIKEYPAIPKEPLLKYLNKYYDCNNKQFLRAELYIDMLKAEEYFKLDLTQEKNIFPHDFDKWHDHYTSQMRISQNKAIDEKIDKQAKKYHKLEKEIDGLKLILPHETEEFIKEGKALHHCVGRMGYNEKMAKGQCLIFFIRKQEELNVPFVTMEYDPKKKKIRQFYADHNSTPEESVRDIIYNKWLPKVQRLKIA